VKPVAFAIDKFIAAAVVVANAILNVLNAMLRVLVLFDKNVPNV